MNEEDAHLEREAPGPAPDDVGHPRGTLVIMLGFLMMLVGLYSSIYLLMLERA